jgi:hypothetical protein
MSLYLVSSLLYEHQAKAKMVLGLPKDGGLRNYLNVINNEIIKLLLNSILQASTDG